MRMDISSEHTLINQQWLSFDQNILDTSDKVRLHFSSHQSVQLGMTSDEQSVMRVGRGDARNTDTRLGEDAVHRKGYHVFGFHGWKQKSEFVIQGCFYTSLNILESTVQSTLYTL